MTKVKAALAAGAPAVGTVVLVAPRTSARDSEGAITDVDVAPGGRIFAADSLPGPGWPTMNSGVMAELRRLRDNLHEMCESSRPNISAEELWLHIRALTSILDAALKELIWEKGT